MRGGGTWVSQPNVFYGLGQLSTTNSVATIALGLGLHTTVDTNSGVCGAASNGEFLQLFHGGTYKITMPLSLVNTGSAHTSASGTPIAQITLNVYDSTGTFKYSKSSGTIYPGMMYLGLILTQSGTNVWVVEIPPMGQVDVFVTWSAQPYTDTLTDNWVWDIIVERISHGTEW